ncbi:MAG: methyltransferase domain-containing protein [Geothrix sp.]|nr:methyltransferase domain-containing protein [Geothrix sp.]
MPRLQAVDSSFPHAMPIADSIAKVVARLEGAPGAGARWLRGYGMSKVRMDQLYPAALSLIPPGDRVLDLGCGIGLLGLLLEARGLCNETLGIEWDPAKAQFGQRTAEGKVGTRILCGDLFEVPWPPCSVVTVLDVLHYLPAERQRALLFRIGAHLPEGGRLLLRVMDAQAGGMAILTRLAERLAVGFGWNLAPRVHWRSLADLRIDLADAGFSLRLDPGTRGAMAGNQILLCIRGPKTRHGTGPSN